MIIVYCIDSIHGVGGIQHVTMMKANALAEMEDNVVWILYADHSGKCSFPLSPKVHTIDLGINYYEDDWKSRWYVLKGILIRRRKHQKALKQALNEIQPDIVVSVGQSEKNLVPAIRGKWATVREFHFVRNYRKLVARSVFDRILALGGAFVEFFSLKKYDSIVTLTQEDLKRNWPHWKKVSVIPNPAQLSPAQASLESNRILAVGRLVYQKNFSSLIRAFALVAKRYPQWSLDIFGEGPERHLLSTLINALGLSEVVHLKGLNSKIQEIMPDYSVFTLTSIFEGFALVLIEAQSCGLPVVSYACPCGPRDIIRDGINGFLVPPGDETALAERICQLIEDENLRRKMGRLAAETAKRFGMDIIVHQWMDLFRSLTQKKCAL
jgi:glycosyltransferase involved in cell wall biosynthesis